MAGVKGAAFPLPLSFLPIGKETFIKVIFLGCFVGGMCATGSGMPGNPSTSTILVEGRGLGGLARCSVSRASLKGVLDLTFFRCY